jgi:two-component system chemotaxis response regulator CheY
MFLLSSHILVVDDMSSVRKRLVRALGEMGYAKVSMAEDGNRALEVIQQSADGQKIDLVISDWNMPVMNGMELLKAVRAIPEFKNLPFILVNAECEKPQVLGADHSEVSGFILKPVDLSSFREKLEAVYQSLKTPD